jgi:RNA polymerase sigma-70 factor (ECF subfamily)
MADEAQETLWVLRAQVGDRDALDALFRAVQPPLARYVAGLVGRPALAEDVLQEVLVRAYRSLGALRDPRLFRPWCYRIATREAVRRLRRERRWAEQLRGDEPLRGAEARPGGPADDGPGLLDRLPGLLGRVSPSSRVVLALHYLGGLTLEEVAEVLGLAAGTVKSRLAYGLAALRRLLQDGPRPGPAGGAGPPAGDSYWRTQP